MAISHHQLEPQEFVASEWKLSGRFPNSYQTDSWGRPRHAWSYTTCETVFLGLGSWLSWIVTTLPTKKKVLKNSTGLFRNVAFCGCIDVSFQSVCLLRFVLLICFHDFHRRLSDSVCFACIHTISDSVGCTVWFAQLLHISSNLIWFIIWLECLDLNSWIVYHPLYKSWFEFSIHWRMFLVRNVPVSFSPLRYFLSLSGCTTSTRPLRTLEGTSLLIHPSFAWYSTWGFAPVCIIWRRIALPASGLTSWICQHGDLRFELFADYTACLMLADPGSIHRITPHSQTSRQNTNGPPASYRAFESMAGSPRSLTSFPRGTSPQFGGKSFPLGRIISCQCGA